jgi:metal-responsive CopG/Arc/MetJ family transcriptional regulator
MILANKPTKEKITVSVDADLLEMVDSFVQNSKESNVSRSSVFEQALQLWKQELRDKFDEHYYAQNAEALKDSSWTALTTEAAKHIWRE